MTQRADDIAVIVPVFNRARSVVEALDSIAAQTLQPGLVVVIDDASFDGSADAVEAWRQAHPALRLTLLRETENVGAAVSRNRGAAAAADFPLLAFLDSDDLWAEDHLRLLRQALDEHSDAIVAGTSFWDVDCRSGERAFRDTSHLVEAPARCYVLDHQPLFMLQGSLMRRSAFDAVGGFDERFRKGQDKLLFLRLSITGRFVHVSDAPFSYRRFQGESTGEAGSLHNIPGRRVNSARLMEVFLHECGGREHLPAKLWRRRLAWLQYKAARSLMKVGRGDEARAWLDKTLALEPLHFKARLFRLTLMLGLASDAPRSR